MLLLVMLKKITAVWIGVASGLLGVPSVHAINKFIGFTQRNKVFKLSMVKVEIDLGCNLSTANDMCILRGIRCNSTLCNQDDNIGFLFDWLWLNFYF